MLQETLIAGDSLNFGSTTPGYSAADGWVLRFRLVPRVTGPAPIDITAAADGANYITQLAASLTAAWTAGVYSWSAWVEKGTEKYTVQTGQTCIKPDHRQAVAGADTRTQAERALDDARAALAAWSPTRRRYRIGDREMEFNNTAGIIEAVTYWENQVARERRAADVAAGRADRRRTHVRLGRV